MAGGCRQSRRAGGAARLAAAPRAPTQQADHAGAATVGARRRVLLYNPRVYDGYARLPLSLLSLERMLPRERYEVELLDGNVDPAARERLFELAGEAVAVGVTVMPGKQTLAAYADSLALKQRLPELPVIWGGYFPSMYPEPCLRSGATDVVVRGLGEPGFPELVRAYAERIEPDLEHVPGALALRRGELVHGSASPLLDVNHLPPLDFERLPLERYLNHTWLGKRTMFTISSIGCPFSCGFCAIPAVNGQRWNTYAPATVIGQVRDFVERLGVDGVQFMDTEFFVNERRVAELAEGFAGLPSPIGWWAMGQVDRLVHYRESTWQLLRDSGCRGIFVGVESGSQAVLDLVGKHIQVEQALEFAGITRRWGILPEFSFVLGFPPAPEQDIAASLELMYRLKAINPQAHLVPHVYTPLPETGNYNLATANRFAAPESLESWTSRRWLDFGRMRGTATPWLSRKLRSRLGGLETVITFLNYLDADKSTNRINRHARRLLGMLTQFRWKRRRYRWPRELVGVYRLGRLSVKVAERRHRGRPLSVEDGYARWAASYERDLATNPLARADWQLVNTLLPALDGKRVLDAACGTGRYGRLAASLGAEVVAVDTSAEMLEEPQHRVRSRADVRQLPFADGAFEVVVFALAAVHQPKVDVRELARVLRSGGVLIVSDLHPYGQVQGWACTFAGGTIRTFAHTLEDYRSAFREAGLMLEAELVGAAPEDLPAEFAGKPLAIAFRGRKC